MVFHATSTAFSIAILCGWANQETFNAVFGGVSQGIGSMARVGYTLFYKWGDSDDVRLIIPACSLGCIAAFFYR